MEIDPHAKFGTRECPSCAVEVAENQNRCPICGYEFPALPVRSQAKLFGGILMLAIFVIVVFGLLRFLGG